MWVAVSFNVGPTRWGETPLAAYWRHACGSKDHMLPVKHGSWAIFVQIAFNQWNHIRLIASTHEWTACSRNEQRTLLFRGKSGTCLASSRWDAAKDGAVTHRGRGTRIWINKTILVYHSAALRRNHFRPLKAGAKALQLGGCFETSSFIC